MRRAFTLVELLVTISIIAVLSALALGALYSAQDQAKTMKTRGTIVKLHNAMMARYESYKTRRVPIVIPADEPYTDVNGNKRYDSGEPFSDINGNGVWDYGQARRAAIKLSALRMLMQLEMPDRLNEIPDASVSFVSVYPGITMPIPAASRSYARRMGSPSDTQFSAAECLYLIVNMATGDSDSLREMFNESEIGDKDGDGLFEFHDAWKNPISWVRWPAGFASELQSLDPDRQHDAFDFRQVHPEAYHLYPLIFSPGPDGNYEINSEPTYAYTRTSAGILNPYAASEPTPLIGGWTDQNGDGENGSVDNIHNHLIGTR